ncbi:MAG: DUF1330 domain-containing protein [Chloroflexi bacterium]|nr:DUF1330 domain-containing protein [Chloroflexota bacterium]MYD48345.1 DUF1330 domain-containing protein [Chloroflexota bacterium]
MKGYVVIIDTEINDPEGLAAMSERVRQVVTRDHGEVLVRGGAITPKHGNAAPPVRMTVVEFNSVEDAEALFEDAGVRELQEERHRYATSTAFIIEGV